MRVVIHVNHAEHQRIHGEAMKEGLKRHGIDARYAGWNQPTGCDVAVCWGWKQSSVKARQSAADGHVLVMERGYIPDRMVWTSAGWDGLNNRATFPKAGDEGQRFDAHFGHLLRTWVPDRPGALVCGQVPGDQALYGLDFRRWASGVAGTLIEQGWHVVYRPHPLVRRQGGGDWKPTGTELSRAASLEEDLARVGLVVTYNSNAGVEAVLAGVPTITMDEGAMAWAVTSHDLGHPAARPDRREWCAWLAWCQWRLDEIRDGTAWAHLREALPC